MDSQRWGRIKQIFDKAQELPVGERTSFVRQQCDGDGELALLDEALAIRLKAYGEVHEDVAETRALLASLEDRHAA